MSLIVDRPCFSTPLPRCPIKVILATSVPPRISRKLRGGVEWGLEYQRFCIESWAKAGVSVVSVNTESETEVLAHTYPGLEVAPVPRHAAITYGRPFVWVDDVLQMLAATDADIVGIINSDIALRLVPGELDAVLDLARDGLVVYNRTEVDGPHQATGPLYRYGFDVYFFPRRYIERFRMEGLALGVPWWDYWMLLNAVFEGIPIHLIQNDSARHLTHPNNWDLRAWEKAARVIALRIRQYQRRFNGRSADDGVGAFSSSVIDLMLGSLRFDSNANFLGGSLNHGLGTMFGLCIVNYVEQFAVYYDAATAEVSGS